MTATPRAIELTRAAADAAADKLAEQIIAFDVSDQLVITDVFVICSANNAQKARAIQDAVEERLAELGVKAARREGAREGRWILLDFAEIVVHIQHAEDRAYYSLERLWSDCPTVALELPPR